MACMLVTRCLRKATKPGRYACACCLCVGYLRSRLGCEEPCYLELCLPPLKCLPLLSHDFDCFTLFHLYIPQLLTLSFPQILRQQVEVFATLTMLHTQHVRLNDYSHKTAAQHCSGIKSVKNDSTTVHHLTLFSASSCIRACSDFLASSLTLSRCSSKPSISRSRRDTCRVSCLKVSPTASLSSLLYLC